MSRSSALNLRGDVRRVDLSRPGTHEKGWEPNLFVRKVAAHAAAHVGSNVTSTRKRVRLPPLLMPVTHLVFAFPSRRESLQLFPPLVCSAACPARPNPTESHGNEPDLAETGWRKSNHQDFVKKISEEEFSHFCILGDGLLGWEPNVYGIQVRRIQ